MKRKEWLNILLAQPIHIGHRIGFTDLTKLNNEWIKKFILKESDLTLQAHRGSYKTTCLAIAVAILMVLNPSRNIIIVRKTDNDVKEFTLLVRKILNNQIMKDAAMGLYGEELFLENKSVYEINTSLNNNPSGALQYTAVGLGTSITGKHADLIITDDIVNNQDRISRAERERTKYIYQELQNVKNKGGRIINTGTPWHEDDCFSIMPNAEKYDCYSTGILSKKEIKDLKSKMTASLFAANYELKHIADDDVIFTNPSIEKIPEEMMYNGICHIDASYGGSDYTAFTILKKAENGKIYVYGALRPEHVNSVLPFIEQKRKQYRAGTIYLENNADKGYLAERIKNPVGIYHENMNKFVKITTYLLEEWSNIIFTDDTDKEYIDQITDYNENAEHDDAPDSLASLIRESKNKASIKGYRFSF